MSGLPPWFALSRKNLLVLYCRYKLCSETAGPLPTAAGRIGHRREQAMILIGLIIVIAVLATLTIQRMRRRP